MKIEQYLNSIKPKEVIYLFASIPIVIFIIYYNFIYPSFVKQNNKLNSEIKTNKKELVKTVTEIRNIRKINKSLPSVERKLEKLKEDFKYIKYNLAYVNIITLDENRVYSILEKILNKSNKLQLNTSFSIKWNQDYPPFERVLNINIKGNGNFLNIIKYIQYLENIDGITVINKIKIGDDDMNNILKNTSNTQTFDINLNLMGIK